MKQTYSEQLKDPRWQRKRLEKLNEANFECEDCGGNQKTLHVHHVVYKKNKAPWEYDSSLLKVVCEDCHAFIHKQKTDLKENLEIIEMEGLGIEYFYWLGYGIADNNKSALQAVLEGVEHKIKMIELKEGL